MGMMVRAGRVLALTIAVAAVLAACGGDDETSAVATTTEGPTCTLPDGSVDRFGRSCDNPMPEVLAAETLTVRVTAEQAGLGCTASKERAGLEVGNDSRLTVEDGEGTIVGTATFQLSPGLEPGVDTCDWTAVVPDVPTDADFYRLEAVGELATVSRAELVDESWSVELVISVTGSVTVGGP